MNDRAIDVASSHAAPDVERLVARCPDMADAIRRAAAAAPAEAPIAGRPDGLAVAGLLADIDADSATVVAGLLCPPEVASVEPDAGLAASYGETVAQLARNARWLNAFREAGGSAQPFEPAERLRRMILALGQDVRAVLIRLAYCTCRLRGIRDDPAEVRERIAREALELYAPLANRLGAFHLKWEMEDRAFRCLEPETYRRIADGLAERRADREAFVGRFTEELRTALAEDGMGNTEVFGRPKHIYSIWRKMQRKHVDFDEVFDVHAVRVLVDRVQECYTALGTVHGRWRHVPQEFDDYIANPKDNGYRSLHTAVIGPGGRPVEVQIRTRTMNEHAERGIAAHWLYKEGSGEGSRLQHSINALRALLDSGGDEGLGDAFGRELFADRVFVFTPRGDVLDLPNGATVLDFAFAIHTEVGFRCRGAKVNGHIVQLTHALANGDNVEVLTTREPRPSRDWLNRDLGYLATGRARAKVRTWFNQQDQAQHLEDGRALLERELRRLNVRDLALDRLRRELGHERLDDLYIALGRNELSSARVATAVQQLTRPADAPLTKAATPPPAEAAPGEAIRIEGVGNVLTRMASCCKPVPGDSIVGFITRGRGVTVHRRDCHNVLRLGDEERNRLIEVDWGNDEGARNWEVDITVTAYDRSDLLRDITTIFSEDRIRLTRADVEQRDDRPEVRIRIGVRVRDMAQLQRLLRRIEQLPNVLEAIRGN